MTSARVRKALAYAARLVGTKYGLWTGGWSTCATEAPFWVNIKALPSPQKVKAQSCNCAGMINLMRHAAGLPIPGVEAGHKFAGGTWVWFHHLKKKGVLEPFDIHKKYPAGTLLLRNYKNVTDQGHVAVISKAAPTGVLYSKLLHCHSANEGGPGVVIDPAVGKSHFWHPKGYYTHACLPEDWLGRK